MPSAGGVASPGGVPGPGVQGPGGVPGLGGIADLGAGTDRLPLPALLSQVLVAFTIELDNEFERLMRHRTTSHGSTAGSRHAPWLTSMVMWSNCLRFVGEDGVTVGELQRLARTGTNLDGMRRWGYIIIEPDPADKGAKRPRSDMVLRATQAGREAQEVWRPLFDLIEKRWQARFGEAEIGQLREALQTMSGKLDPGLPDCLPILGYGLFSKGRHPGGDRYWRTYAAGQARAPAGPGPGSGPGAQDSPGSRLPLSALLSRVLLGFAIEFEHESDLSLAISANVVRVLNEKGVRIRDLPVLTGVSKEAVSMAMGFLQKGGFAAAGPDEADGSRWKVARLTRTGSKAQDTYRQLSGSIEQRWQPRFGEENMTRLRESLARLTRRAGAQPSPLFRGLEPYPGGWRASVRKPRILPHYPMVLHRGGFPDGS